jgi:DNA-binding HxlR family transcriptional regulator
MTYLKKRPPLDFCPIEAVVGLVGGRWKARLLDRLSTGEQRLSLLEAAIPGAPRQVLIQQLEAMAADGLVVVRHQAVGHTSYRVYALSPLGAEVHGLLALIATWADQRLR